MNDPVEQSLIRVAEAVGPDVAYLTPPGERRFDPITLAITFAGLLVAAYAKGFVSQATSDAEDIGRQSAIWLRERVRALIETTTVKDATDATDLRAATEAARKQATDEARAALAEVESSVVDRNLAAGRTALQETLQTEWDFPPRAAARIVASVESEVALRRTGEESESSSDE